MGRLSLKVVPGSSRDEIIGWLGDCPGLLQHRGDLVEARACLEPCERLSVNTPDQLAVVAAALEARTA